MSGKRKWNKRIGSLLLALLLACGVSPQMAQAAEGLDTSQAVTLTVAFKHNGTALSGATFRLYRVAEITADGNDQETGEFAQYSVLKSNMDSTDWKAAAETYASYIERDQIQPMITGQTGQKGTLRFPAKGETLQTGVYLVTGETFTADDGKIYEPEPFLVSLPYQQATDDWIYDMNANVKYAVTDPNEKKPATETVTAVKVWDAKDHESDRPSEVTVQLLKGGEVEEEATLNDANNWTCTWTKLEEDQDWSVVEKNVPSGYKVGVNHEDSTYTITNTYEPSKVVSESNPPTSEEPQSSDTSTTEETGEKLPQTGMLWWPVTLLAAAGMLIFVIGWLRYKKSEDEK